MLHTSIVKAIRRDLGGEPKADPNTTADYGGWFFRHGGAVISWTNDRGQVVCLNVRRESDHDDPQSDYFAGSWCYTIRRAIGLFGKMQQWEAEAKARRLSSTSA